MTSEKEEIPHIQEAVINFNDGGQSEEHIGYLGLLVKEGVLMIIYENKTKGYPIHRVESFDTKTYPAPKNVS